MRSPASVIWTYEGVLWSKSRALLVLGVLLLAALARWDIVRGATFTARVEAQPTGETQQVQVTRVVDGDTIEVWPNADGASDVRLIEVDTSETVDPDEPVEPCGPEGTAFTKEQLEGQQVTLEFDEERTDRYDRALAYVFKGEELFNYRCTGPVSPSPWKRHVLGSWF